MHASKKTSGFTLIEVLMITSIIALLLVSTAVYMLSSLNRGRDGRRKADLRRVAELLEEHYNDKGSYPTAAQMNACGSDPANPLTNYQATVPCEPQTGVPYYYVPSPANCGAGQCLRYRLLTTLEYKEDPDIERVGCHPTNGCGGYKQDGVNYLDDKYNYGLSAGMTVQQSPP